MKFSSNYYRSIKLMNTRYFISSYFLRGTLNIIIFSAALNQRNDGTCTIVTNLAIIELSLAKEFLRVNSKQGHPCYRQRQTFCILYNVLRCIGKCSQKKIWADFISVKFLQEILIEKN